MAWQHERFSLFIPKLLKIGAMVTFLRVFYAELSTMKKNEKETGKKTQESEAAVSKGFTEVPF